MTKGMSLIDPRPERPAFCAEFEKRIHGWHYRTMVTPGLSGLAQVTGGYDLLPKEKVVLDLWQHEPRLVVGLLHDIGRFEQLRIWGALRISRRVTIRLWLRCCPASGTVKDLS